MSRFLTDAMSLLESAERAAQCGSATAEWTILVTAEGSIRMFADSDWPLASLQRHHGAQSVYRVSDHNSKIRVEGCQASRSCCLESESPARAARILLGYSPSSGLSPRKMLAASSGPVSCI